MTAAEFTAWLERRGLIPATAAPLLAAQPSEVSRWANGTRKVPPRIARIIDLLIGVGRMENKLAKLQADIRYVLESTRYSDMWVIQGLLEDALKESEIPAESTGDES